MEQNNDRNHAPERELLEAARTYPFVRTTGDRCLSAEVLQAFSKGSIQDEDTRNEILAHLRGCPTCIATLTQFRKATEVVQARQSFWHGHSRRLATALVAIIVLTLILLLWPARLSWLRRHTEVAVLDLRDASITRSVERPAATLSRYATSVRILLPAETPTGTYEVAFFIRISDPPMLKASGVATSSASGTNIFVHLDAQLSPGKYILGLKNKVSEWKYFSVQVNNQR